MIISQYQEGKQWVPYPAGEKHMEKVIDRTVEFNRSPLLPGREWNRGQGYSNAQGRF